MADGFQVGDRSRARLHAVEKVLDVPGCVVVRPVLLSQQFVPPAIGLPGVVAQDNVSPVSTGAATSRKPS